MRNVGLDSGSYFWRWFWNHLRAYFNWIFLKVSSPPETNWLSLGCSSGIHFNNSPDDFDVQPHWFCLVYRQIWNTHSNTAKTSTKSIKSTSDYRIKSIVCYHFHLCLAYEHMGNSMSFYRCRKYNSKKKNGLTKDYWVSGKNEVGQVSSYLFLKFFCKGQELAVLWLLFFFEKVELILQNFTK